MQTRRLSQRCLTAWLLVASLLFSQLALASYVCPSLSAQERMSERMTAGMPCDGDDTSTPVLCHQHATNASQSFEMAKVAGPSLPAPMRLLVLRSPRPGARRSGAVRGSTGASTARSVFLQTLRLRV
jgi:hypothetical protein